MREGAYAGNIAGYGDPSISLCGFSASSGKLLDCGDYLQTSFRTVLVCAGTICSGTSISSSMIRQDGGGSPHQQRMSKPWRASVRV